MKYEVEPTLEILAEPLVQLFKIDRITACGDTWQQTMLSEVLGERLPTRIRAPLVVGLESGH
jgi:hypothetical protein